MIDQRLYKDDIINRLGGQTMFDLTIAGIARSLQTESELSNFYSSFRYEDLIEHQKQFFTSIFAKDHTPGQLRSSILLRNYVLIQQGFNEIHFDLLVEHFVAEMEASWVNKIAIQDAVSILRTIRYVFESSRAENSVEANEAERITKISTNNAKTGTMDSSQESEKSRRGSSGEFLLDMFRTKGTKKTKQQPQ
jgi:hypothetical protein